jgi:hypothetical protein
MVCHIEINLYIHIYTYICIHTYIYIYIHAYTLSENNFSFDGRESRIILCNATRDHNPQWQIKNFKNCTVEVIFISYPKEQCLQKWNNHFSSDISNIDFNNV